MSDVLKPPVDVQAELQNKFINDHMRRIFLQIYRIVGNVDDAQDLTQEVFIKALQRSEQIKDAAKAAHWLSRVATNTAIDHLRRRGKANLTQLEEIPDPARISAEESPEERVLRAERRHQLDGGLEQLSERERLALLLRDVEDMPAEEVAAELRCSKATVRSHIANARTKFRKYWERNRL